MGVPPFTSHEGLRIELALVKPFIRLQGERIKVFFRVKHNQCPIIVHQCWQSLQNLTGSQKRTYSLFGKTKKEAIDNQRNWILSNRSSIHLGSFPSFNAYLKALTTVNVQSKYGFKWVYPVNTRQGGHKALVYVRADIKREGVFCPPHIEQRIVKVVKKTHGRRKSQRTHLAASNPMTHRPSIKNAVRFWMQEQQLDCYMGRKGCKKLSRLTGRFWYHDKLLHETETPWIRQLRKLRLGVSRLADHNSHIEAKPKTCLLCDIGENETVTHFLLHCKAHVGPRRRLLQGLKKMGVKRPTVSLLLGFDLQLTSKVFRKRSFRKRRDILQMTLCFLQDSQRFTCP